MSYPSKIEQLCSDLRCYIDIHCKAGDKLPSEPMLARIMAVSSRTLGTAMRQLANEGRIIRNNHGSFVCGKDTPRARSVRTLTLLLPSSDFSFNKSHVSSLANYQMIQGAQAAAKKYQCQVCTIPVTDSNDPSDINPLQLSNLDSDSMVMFQSIWYERLFPLFWERRFRLAFLNCGPNSPQKIPAGIDCFMVHYGNYQTGLIEKSMDWFAAQGAQHILIAGNSGNQVLMPQQKNFATVLNRYSDRLKCRLWNDDLNYFHWTAWLRKVYAEEKFDGLLLVLDPYQYCDQKIDFYEQTAIPVSLPLLVTESMLLKQKRIGTHARVIRLPTENYSMRGAEFLLSGRHGLEYVNAEYAIRMIDPSDGAGLI